MVMALKGKLINWSTCRLSLAGRILVANQVLLASMWYIAAAWNPNPAMCSQIRGIVRNFIWSRKASNARAKVKWETLVLPTDQGGLGIIDPKAQSEALLAKLFIRGLAHGGEPWKELLRHRANQVRLSVHGLGPSTQNINWMFAAMKFKRQCPLAQGGSPHDALPSHGVKLTWGFHKVKLRKVETWRHTPSFQL